MGRAEISRCLSCPLMDCQDACPLNAEGTKRRNKQSEFAQLAERGMPDYRIALRLGVSFTTVQKWHRKLAKESEV